MACSGFLCAVAPADTINVAGITTSGVHYLGPGKASVLRSFVSGGIRTTFGFRGECLGFVSLTCDRDKCVGILSGHRNEVCRFSGGVRLVATFNTLNDCRNAFADPITVRTYNSSVLILSGLGGGVAVFDVARANGAMRGTLNLCGSNGFGRSVRP